MKNLCPALMLFFALYYGCVSKPVPELDYCAMYDRDQSNVNNDKSDMVKYTADKVKRRNIFKENFSMLMKYAKENGFPNTSMHESFSDSCKYNAISATLIHMSQAYPDIFYSEKQVKFFNDELNSSRLNKEILRVATIISLKSMEFCPATIKRIYDAVDIWEIDLPDINVDMLSESEC